MDFMEKSSFLFLFVSLRVPTRHFAAANVSRHVSRNSPPREVSCFVAEECLACELRRRSEERLGKKKREAGSGLFEKQSAL